MTPLLSVIFPKNKGGGQIALLKIPYRKKKGIFTEISKIFFAFGEKQGEGHIEEGGHFALLPLIFILFLRFSASTAFLVQNNVIK